jgi:hypothetical protein
MVSAKTKRRFVMKTAIHFTLLSFFFIALLSGCSSHPKITLEAIQRDLVGKNAGEGIVSWTFDKNEPREISIVESKYEGDNATIIIDIKTHSAPGSIMKSQMAGKLRLHYERIKNEWSLTRIENLTFKES